TRKYAADDFIREENIENVRKLELLAGDIRNEAQPQEQAVEANLTEVLDKTHAALEIVYGKPSDLSREECNLFLSLFETYGIVVT
ncbi:MAG: hypothetical protein KDD62_11970, partial [Bdellovibrionales bacterium]|nr:hypothetical protein [Bdellovibrionales bacterium]